MARTILIVEDDEATRVGLLVLLAEAGYRTIGAANLKQATELLAQQNPDLMVVDVRLGGDNGLQLVAMAIQPIHSDFQRRRQVQRLVSQHLVFVVYADQSL